MTFSAASRYAEARKAVEMFRSLEVPVLGVVENMTGAFGAGALVGPEAMGIEYFRLVRGQVGSAGANGLEDDLFAGLG